MNKEDRIRSIKRSLGYLHIAAKIDPDIHRALGHYTLLQILYGFALGMAAASLIVTVVVLS